MKKKKQTVQEPVAESATPVVEATPVQEPKTWIVNCPKCGAALSMKDGGCAYMCPVCKTLLRVKTGARLVKDVTEGDKKLHVTLTQSAVNYLVGKTSCDGTNKPTANSNLESMLAKNVAEGYTADDSFVVDADENGLNVKKA